MPQSDSGSIICIDKRLNYVSQDAEVIPPVLAKLYGTKVTSFDLSFNKLKALNSLESFTKLEELIADNNEIDDSVIFPPLENLHTLSLNKNKIINLDNLLAKIKASFPKLKFLSILGNEACPNQLSHSGKDDSDYQRYRHYVVYHLPSLIFLDSSPVNLNERQEAQNRGQFMKQTCLESIVKDDKTPPQNYSPLPSNENEVHGKGFYSKRTYRYNGKHSEGNRFITSHDL